MLGAELPGLLNCRRCPRLVQLLGDLPPRRGLSRSDYWNRPVPGFGDRLARVCLVGLAPGAHGANRTGRPFTGDGAGDFMYPLLHQAGFSNQPRAVAADDGLRLHDLYLTNAVKCLPPGNKPRADEFHACRGFLLNELAALPRLRVVVALGGDAFRSMLQVYKAWGVVGRFGDYPFGHGVVYPFAAAPSLVGSYHTSRYNIQTGRLTVAMFQDLLQTVRRLAG